VNAPNDVDVRADVVETVRKKDSHWGFGHEITYRLTLARADVETPSDVTSVKELPAALGVEALSVEAGTHDASCRKRIYPYPCTIRLEDGERAPTELVVDVTFEDGLQGRVRLDVDRPPRALPEIASFTWQPVEPGGDWTAPHRWSMAFDDIGADEYEIILEFQIGGPGPVTGGGGNPFTDMRWRIRDGALVEKMFVVTAEPSERDGELVTPPGSLTRHALCGRLKDGAGWARECAIVPAR